nr:MAG TPA: hypothetical protein [Caudoviricetes sp.]
MRPAGILPTGRFSVSSSQSLSTDPRSDPQQKSERRKNNV